MARAGRDRSRDFESLNDPVVRRLVERSEPVELKQFVLFYVLWREHPGDLPPLEVHHDELVDRSQLRHRVDEELPIAFDFRAGVALQSDMAQSLQSGQVL